MPWVDGGTSDALGEVLRNTILVHVEAILQTDTNLNEIMSSLTLDMGCKEFTFPSM